MIFLDVGSHAGQTLQEVLRPEYHFDTVYAFEPMLTQYKHLIDTFGDPRLVACNYGLLDRTSTLPVYGSNDDMEASVYAEKRDVNADIVTQCEFVEAATFFAENVHGPAIMKLNCEGSEVLILRNLLDSGELWKLDNVLIDFDVRKVPGQEGAEADILERLGSAGFTKFSLADVVMKGETHQDRIRNWLHSAL